MSVYVLMKQFYKIAMPARKANELESFIYEVRGWLSGPDRALLKPDAIEPILDKEQLWFEDPEVQISP